MAAPRKHLSTDEELWAAMAESLSVRQGLARIGLVPTQGNYKTVQSRIRQLGLNISYFPGKGRNAGPRCKAFGRKAALEEILIEHSTYAFTHGLRGQLLEEGVKRPQCKHCGLAVWCGQSIPLELQHVNDVNNDHRLSNLHLLCTNCHALVNDCRGKNQNNKKA